MNALWFSTIPQQLNKLQVWNEINEHVSIEMCLAWQYAIAIERTRKWMTIYHDLAVINKLITQNMESIKFPTRDLYQPEAITNESNSINGHYQSDLMVNVYIFFFISQVNDSISDMLMKTGPFEMYLFTYGRTSYQGCATNCMCIIQGDSIFVSTVTCVIPLA